MVFAGYPLCPVGGCCCLRLWACLSLRTVAYCVCVQCECECKDIDTWSVELKGEHRRHGHGCGPRHRSAPVGALARADLHVRPGHIRVREITMGLRDPACLLSFLRPPGEQSLAVSRRAGFQTVLSPPSQAGGVSASVSGVLHPGGLFRPQASTTLRDGGCCDVGLTCDA